MANTQLTIKYVPLSTDVKFQDLTGRRFGRLVVVGFVGNVPKPPGRWHCKCDCGNEKIIIGAVLRRGDTKSCGCLQKDIASKVNGTHRMTNHPLYGIWKQMWRRCTNPKERAYGRYGGRGITICARWQNIHRFIEDMGMPPTDRHSLDRIDNNGNYEPSNCKWSTQQEQVHNSTTVRLITINGETHPLYEWAKLYGIGLSSVYERMERKGWDIVTALTHPKMHRLPQNPVSLK